MGKALRKDPTRRGGGPGTRIQGSRDGLTLRGRVRTQDTGRTFGGVNRRVKPIRPAGKGV